VIENREPKYWPFKVLPQEKQTDQHKSVICFLESAYQLGYRPYTFYAGDYGASSEGGRVGEIIVRGRARWEIVLGGPNKDGGSAFVDSFDYAANAVIAWLTGAGAVDIFASMQDHLVLMGSARRTGRPFRLWSEDPAEFNWPKTKPCPYCGKLLRTEKSQQCFMCGMDWHDPNRVVQHACHLSTNPTKLFRKLFRW
jgi:hypothetical protein